MFLKRKVEFNMILDTPVKIVLLGESTTGKSALFHKLNTLTESDYQFNKKHCATDNFDFNRLQINTSCGIASIDLWDTAGQENKGGLLRDAYLKGADGVLLLYDVSNQATIANLSKWMQQIKRVAPYVPIAVIGNKADTIDDIQRCDTVRLRECNLQRDIGHNKIKNFLISIKEDTYIKIFNSWTQDIITTEQGCLVGLEYILATIYKQPMTIIY